MKIVCLSISFINSDKIFTLVDNIEKQYFYRVEYSFIENEFGIGGRLRTKLQYLNSNIYALHKESSICSEFS